MAVVILIILVVIFLNAQSDEPQESVGWLIVGVFGLLIVIGSLAGGR